MIMITKLSSICFLTQCATIFLVEGGCAQAMNFIMEKGTA